VQTAGEALNQPLPGAASGQSQVQGWKYRTRTFTDSWQMATGKTAPSADSQQVDLKAKNWAKRSDGIAVKSEIINALIMFIQYYLKKRFQ
jgi:hypothetical protein